MLRLFSISLASGPSQYLPIMSLSSLCMLLLCGNSTSLLHVLGAEIDFKVLTRKRRMVVTPRVPSSRGNMTQRGELSSG